jgi:hypothetical protein
MFKFKPKIYNKEELIDLDKYKIYSYSNYVDKGLGMTDASIASR